MKIKYKFINILNPFFLLLTPLYFFNNAFLKSIGSISIVYNVISSTLTIIKHKKIYNYEEFKFFIIFTIYSFLILIWKFSSRGLLEFLIQTAMLFNFIFLGKFTRNRNILYRVYLVIYRIIYYFLVILSLYIIYNDNGGLSRSVFYFNEYFNPVLYKLLLPLGMFYLYYEESLIIPRMIFLSLLFFLLVERTMLISIIIFLSIFLIYKYFNVSFKYHMMIFRYIFLLLIVTVLLYNFSSRLAFAEDFDIWFWRKTGGRFFSGRNDIWSLIIDPLEVKFFTGRGFNNQYLLQAGTHLSAHNTYLHIVLSTGVVGLSLFYKLLLSFWKELYNSYAQDNIFPIAYILGILFYMNAEVTLIANSIVIGIFITNVMWIHGIQDTFEQ